MMDANQKWEKNLEIVSATMDEEAVMLSAKMGKYFGANKVGSRIWDLLETPCSLAEICDALTAEYAVERAQCQKEADSFLERALKRGLIVNFANQAQ
jgi:hypothetical protein